MAIGTVKSSYITNLEAGLNANLAKQQGHLRTIIDEIELPVTATDDVGDVTLFAALPSNAKLIDVLFMNDALAASGLAFNVGVFYSGKGHDNLSKVSGDVVSANCIATAKVITSANVTWQSIRFEAADIVGNNQELWEIAGLSADPKGILYLGMTVTTVATTPTAGSVVFRVDFIAN